MRLKQWLYGAAALAMLAACSDGDVAPENRDVNNGDAETISGYLAVEIKLPQEAVTRAEDDVPNSANDQFRDGLAEEYKVNNAMIVVFKGANEKTATFQKAVDLTKPFFTNLPSTDQISSSYIAAVPVDKLKQDGTEHYYGLVILNRDGTKTIVPAGKDGFSTGVKIANNDLVKGTTTLTTILGYISDIDFMANGFFMINAPLSNQPGSFSGISDANISYLTDLGTTTYESIDEAKSHITSCVYVERAVAKVTSGMAQNSIGLNFVDRNGADMGDVTVSASVKYALTNTNKKSYVIRNVEKDKLGEHFSWDLVSTITGNGGPRMIGTTKMPGLNTPFHDGVEQDGKPAKPSVDWYRTYWCHDPNYEKDAFTIVENGDNTTEMAVVNKDNASNEFKTLDKPLYCMENTFDVARQSNGNTTMVLFEVDYTVTKTGYNVSDLYVKDGDYSKVYISDKDAAWEEISRIYNNEDIQKALTEALKVSNVTPTESNVVNNAEQYLDVSMDKATRELIIKSIYIPEDRGVNAAGIKAFNDYIGLPTDESSIQYKLLTAVNNLNTITVFDGGVSYYSIPVMHFGNYYCPWDKTISSGTTTKEIYNGNKDFTKDDNHAKNYLGRYGMVRNNWYDLKISEIKTLGSPTIPEINLTLSDDSNEDKRYIGVEIHVLSWAKRSQDVKF